MTESTKPLNKKFLLLMAGLAIVGLTLIIFIEYTIYNLLSFIFYFKTLAVLAIVFLHLLFVRFVVNSFIFPGSNTIFKKIIRLEYSKTQAGAFLRVLTDFRSNIVLFKTNSETDLSQQISYIKNSILVFNLDFKIMIRYVNYYIGIYHDIKRKYLTLSDYQKIFNEHLSDFKERIDESGLEINIEEAYDNINNTHFDYNSIRSKSMDRKIETILSLFNTIEEFLHCCLYKKSWRENLKNFWFNDTFASIQQFRIELESGFECEEYTIDMEIEA
jgi:hypothetical protein